MAGTGAVLLAAPLAAQAQLAEKDSRVGFLFYGASGPSPELDAFRQGLRDLGYIEGQNITIEYRFANGQVGRLPELAAELVRLKLDVIVTPGTPASMAAKKATSTIPIVFAGVAPKASRVAVLYNPADRSNVLVLKELQESSRALGLTLQPLAVRGLGEFEGAFAAMTRERVHALFGAAGVLT